MWCECDGGQQVSTVLLSNVVLVTEEDVQHAGRATLKRLTQSAVSSSDAAHIADVLKASALLHPVVNPGNTLEHERSTPIFQMYPWQSTRHLKQRKAVCLYRQSGWGVCPVQCAGEWNVSDLKWKLQRS